MLVLSKFQLISDLTQNLKGSMREWAVKKYTRLSDEEFINFVSKDISLSLIAPGRFQVHVKSLSDNSANLFEKVQLQQGSYKKIFE
jgi:hypothetical protein